MLIIEITKLELTGGILDYTKYTHCLNTINWRPYWNHANYRDGQSRINRLHIGILLIKEMAKLELTAGHIGFIVFI